MNIGKENKKSSLSVSRDSLFELMKTLESCSSQDKIEQLLKEEFKKYPDDITSDSNDYYSILNYHLYKFCLKHYKHNEQNVCLWRFFKSISEDQLSCEYQPNSEQEMMDFLVRTYYYSDPLDDLTCLFIPISDRTKINEYMNWIRSYFYEVNYPTSLLWFYALDSSLSFLFPTEIIYLGRRIDSDKENIMIPDFTYDDAILIKRFSEKPNDYILLDKTQANREFMQIFKFLEKEHIDRCLSHSGKQDDYEDKITYEKEWEKFIDVLKFGVSDRHERGCISFSDLRSSTDFLNTYGKKIFLNKIQQPFFEGTNFISNKYKGRIDKFMGDNVMCVFLGNNTPKKELEEKKTEVVLSNFLAIFELCKILLDILLKNGILDSKLGLRSGATYGNEILRSNLGNELVRDFTVTGETVNLAARLEHISITELMIHNKTFFSKVIKRYEQIQSLMTLEGCSKNINPETKSILKKYTLYQNIYTNLEFLSTIRFDARFNEDYYLILRKHLLKKGYKLLNKEKSNIYGYEEFQIEGFKFRFYFLYYNPKGFNNFERIWILPIEVDTLQNLNIETIR